MEDFCTKAEWDQAPFYEKGHKVAHNFKDATDYVDTEIASYGTKGCSTLTVLQGDHYGETEDELYTVSMNQITPEGEIK